MKSKQTMMITTLLVLTLTSSTAFAQRQWGAVKGKVTDSEGSPIEKAMIYLDADEMLAMRFFITSKSGRYSFDHLPSGVYRMRVEIPDYTTALISDQRLTIGQTLRIDVELKKSTAEEVETQDQNSSSLRPASSNSTTIIERTALDSLAFSRRYGDVITMAPGILEAGTGFPIIHIFNGADPRSNLYSMDGFKLNDPDTGASLFSIPYDVIDEIEIETGGHAASEDAGDGGYINVVTRSGKNPFYYSLLLQHTNEEMIGLLRSDDEIKDSLIASPPHDKWLYNGSFSLGGALWPDRIWFFGNIDYLNNTRTTAFFPWEDPQGTLHKNYNSNTDEKSAFAKLTAAPITPVKISASFLYKNRYLSHFAPTLDWNLAEEATSLLDHERFIQISGQAHYTINQNSTAYLNAGYLDGSFPTRLQDGREAVPRYIDALTGYRWGSAEFNNTASKKRFQARGLFTHFITGSSGFDAELNAGAAYEYTLSGSDVWKENTLSVSYLDGNPYYFGTRLSPSSGNSVGTGKIGFGFPSRYDQTFNPSSKADFISLFTQNSITFFDRVTINLGLRFDHSSTDLLGYAKLAIGNTVGLQIGEDLIEPTTGINPFNDLSLPDWQNVVVWNEFSPRVGIVIDLFGDGKTLFKGNFARYRDKPSFGLINSLNAFPVDKIHSFYWYDENANTTVDADDSFALFPDDYYMYEENFYKKRVADDLTPPSLQEIFVGFHQQILPDLTFKANGFIKEWSNLIGQVYIDRTTGQSWSLPGQGGNSLWIPFSTVVPGINGSGDTPMTVYFPSAGSPFFFDQMRNVPELKKKYKGIEFSLSKRMTDNWMFQASVRLSETTGNTNAGSGLPQITPNYFINRTASTMLEYDRPLAVKLLGAFRLPWGLMLSASLQHLSGLPLSRTVTILPPEDWALAEGARPLPVEVLLEKPGTERLPDVTRLDLRFEKAFTFSSGARLSFALDVLNSLSRTTDTLWQENAGFWYPTTADSTEGTYLVSPYYNQIVTFNGVKTFRLTIRLGF
ncbi:MAG: TonB-dependent receptor [Acidobacteriota bacterium]